MTLHITSPCITVRGRQRSSTCPHVAAWPQLTDWYLCCRPSFKPCSASWSPHKQHKQPPHCFTKIHTAPHKGEEHGRVSYSKKVIKCHLLPVRRVFSVSLWSTESFNSCERRTGYEENTMIPQREPDSAEICDMRNKNYTWSKISVICLFKISETKKIYKKFSDTHLAMASQKYTISTIGMKTRLRPQTV